MSELQAALLWKWSGSHMMWRGHVVPSLNEPSVEKVLTGPLVPLDPDQVSQLCCVSHRSRHIQRFLMLLLRFPVFQIVDQLEVSSEIFLRLIIQACFLKLRDPSDNRGWYSVSAGDGDGSVPPGATCLQQEAPPEIPACACLFCFMMFRSKHLTSEM